MYKKNGDVNIELILDLISKTHNFDEHSIGHSTCIIKGLGEGKKPRAKGSIYHDKNRADRRASAPREGAYFPRVEEQFALCIAVGYGGLLNVAEGISDNERR